MCRKLLILVVVLVTTVCARAEIMRFESDFTTWTGEDATSGSPVSSSTGHTPGSDWSVTYDGMSGAVGWLTQGDIAGIPTTASFYSPSSGRRARFSTAYRDDWVNDGLQDTGLTVDYGMNYGAGYNCRRGSIQISFPTTHGQFNAYIMVQHTADPHTMIKPLRNGGGSYNVDTLYLKDSAGNPRYIADQWHDWTAVVAYAYADGAHWAYWDLFLDGEQLLFGGADGSPMFDGHTWSFRTWSDSVSGTPYIGLGELDAATVGWNFKCDYVNFANIGARHFLNPNPAHGSTVSDSLNQLQWTLPEPNQPGGVVDCVVYFGTIADPVEDNPKVVDRQAVESVSVTLAPNTKYYWAFDLYDSSISDTVPFYLSPIFTFYAVANLPPGVNAGDDIATWLADGPRVVELDGVVSDDGVILALPTLLWTVITEPNELNPAQISDPHVANPTVTVTESGSYTLQLEAYDGEFTVADRMNIVVYADSCEHAQKQGGFAWLARDINHDCKVDFLDLAGFAAEWLQNNYSTE